MPDASVKSHQFGASLSIKQCGSFSIEPTEVLQSAIDDLGIRRFRLMSYWNEHEPETGQYNFASLDKQVELLAAKDCTFTLCLGARQPRWPESHWPDWAWQATPEVRNEHLLRFIEMVVARYKDSPALVSYQLENEALNRSFGERGDFDRQRLINEYALVKRLDSKHPVIMTTSNNWGIPIRKPRPDIFGTSLYRVEYKNGAYQESPFAPWWYRFRASAIRVLTRRPVFIHELQAEPWGPKAIWEMPSNEQDKSMNSQKLAAHLAFAESTKLYPIDLWGLEWWYWRKKHGDPSLWNTVKEYLTTNHSV